MIDIGLARPRPVPDGGDASFRRSLTELSRQLAARGRPAAADTHALDPHADIPPDVPDSDVEPAPEASQPKPESRHHRRYLPMLVLPVLALALGVALATVYHRVLGGPPEPPQSRLPATVTLSLPPPPEPAPSPSAAEIAPPARVTVDPPPTAAPDSAAFLSKGKLEAYDVLEIQTRLKAIGLNPGPLDGVTGPQTVAAIKRYETSKAQPPTGNADRDLLKRLRQEQDEQARSR